MSAAQCLVDSRQDLLGQEVGIDLVIVIRIRGCDLEAAPADRREIARISSALGGFSCR